MTKILPMRLIKLAAISVALPYASCALAAETDPAVVQKAKSYVGSVMSPPKAWPGPTTSPAVAEGKKITIISCAQASNCSVDANAPLEAAQEIGWQATIIDGKGDPGIYRMLRFAPPLMGAATVLFDISLPTSLVQERSPLRGAAQDFGRKRSRCDLKDPLVFANVEHQWVDQGAMLGQWLIADSDGKAGVVILRDDEFPGVKDRQDTVAKVLATCAGCTISTKSA